MGVIEIIGGFLLVLLCAVIIIAVTLQEHKAGLGSIAGESSSGSFYDKNRGKTKEAMLIRTTAICGVAMTVLVIVILVIAL